MKLTFVLRNKQNALKLSTKTLDSFIERIKTDTKDGAVARRRHEFNHCGSTDSYDQQHPSHQIYPSVEFERDVNDNLRMRTFNGVVALVIDNLQSAEEMAAVKQAAKILHYTLAAFVGPTGNEVIVLVRIAKADGSMPMDEEEADFVCKQGWKLASTIYQGILPKPINQQPASARSWFRMPLDATPYYNPQAVALPVSEKPIAERPHTDESTVVETTNDEGDAEISQETKRLMDYLNSRYVFRYNSIMGYTEYKDLSRKYMEWEPVDDRVMKGMTMKVRLAGIDARDNDIRRYVRRIGSTRGSWVWCANGRLTTLPSMVTKQCRCLFLIRDGTRPPSASSFCHQNYVGDTRETCRWMISDRCCNRWLRCCLSIWMSSTRFRLAPSRDS